MPNSLENIKNFYAGYHSLGEEAFKKYSDNFLRLKIEYLQLKNEYRNLNKTLAEDFNIFQILNVQHYEVSTHSAMIRELLDSTGTHGQGNLFFLEFLNMLSEKEIISNNDTSTYSSNIFDNYSCISEQSVETGRIDIVIERLYSDFPFCFIIENKVWAVDQEKQIERYWQELQKKNIPEDRKKILYLSPNGYLPSEWSIDNQTRMYLENKRILHCISYSRDIIYWLEKVLPKIESEKVRYLVAQYCDILKSL
jgi:hypothetical protein